nr:unnamed protein product [Spirometra erinaceieuropaei]
MPILSTNIPRRTSLLVHLRTQCINRSTTATAASTTAPAPTSTSTATAPTLIIFAPNPRAVLPLISATSIIFATVTAATTGAATSIIPVTDWNAPDTPTTTITFTITTLTSGYVDSVTTCPYCGRTSTTNIGQAGDLRI